MARLHYRGHANRGLRVLAVDGDELPERDTAIVHDGKEVGRVTSAAQATDSVVILGFVRREVPADAQLELGIALQRSYTRPALAPVAQGIERSPAEAEVARSNRAGA